MKIMARSLRIALLAAVTMVTLNSAGAADKRPGMKHDAATVGAIELRKTADCIVKREPRSASRLLATRPMSPNEARVGNGLNGTISNCMTGYVESLTAGFTEMRGFLAEVFYLRENSVDPNFSLMQHDEIPLPSDWVPDMSNQYEVVSMYMLKFGSCVAAADPQNVAVLMRTGVRSSEERAAINQLKPSLSGCLDKGHTFHLDAAILRALTAQSLYRSLATWRILAQNGAITTTPAGKSS